MSKTSQKSVDTSQRALDGIAEIIPVEPQDGVLVVVMRPNGVPAAKVLQFGCLTEGRLEQALPFIYHTVARDREALYRQQQIAAREVSQEETEE